MEKTQLITIAIAALAGAVAKAIVDWIVSIIKTTATVSAVTAKIKIVFSKKNRKVLTDIVVILFYGSILVNLTIKEATPTRLEILLIIWSVLAIVFMLFMLSWHIVEASRSQNENP